MSTLKTILCGAVVMASASFATLTPAHADSDVYIGPDGARVYIDRDRYRDRGYYYERGYRPVYRHYRGRCFDRVDYERRFGYRVRIVERVCYDRFGRPRIVDRDYSRIGW
jgi:hypothetical protein